METGVNLQMNGLLSFQTEPLSRSRLWRKSHRYKGERKMHRHHAIQESCYAAKKGGTAVLRPLDEGPFCRFLYLCQSVEQE